DGFTQADMPIFGAECRRLTGHEPDGRHLVAQSLEQSQGPQGMDDMGVDASLCPLTMQSGQIRFDDAQRARWSPPLGNIDEDNRLIVVLQGESQVVAANAEIDDAHLGSQRRLGQTAGNFTAKGIVAVEDIADAGDEYARLHHASPWIRSSS